MTTQYEEREEWYAFNQETIDALLEDGSQADADYTIEHHFASSDFDMLEKAAVDAFKAGFEVTDAEELMLDDGGTVFCFDAIVERKLDRAKLDVDTDTLLKIADKHKVHYDGWGTYFMPHEGELQ
ncbi:ribonuclease E inhibitor RraB [Alteromonas aestuariivivens]|uniref:Regulator of ribonuclease activity B n=1 Tax=Alteromonas aestuariivivens TaxID=1938339 RepID=A0A3D8MDZ4_9ALTE|nr:ribonuclease E inhibitor RraB [Alteromonas aestuariivivens]RDV28952.1 ribonuclease E inhibitor RraB [Alteromonas aestuariivivens]